MTPPPQRTTGCGSDDVTKPHGVTTGTTAARRSISGLDNSTLRACIARTFDATVDKNTGSCQEHQDFLPYQRQNSSLAAGGVFAKSKGEMVPGKSRRANVSFFSSLAQNSDVAVRFRKSTAKIDHSLKTEQQTFL